MSDTIIKVENLSKRYRIGLKEKKADTFAQQMINVLKYPIDNFRNIQNLGKFQDSHSLPGNKEEGVHWALKDVSFEVKQGEVLGIIGKNGAGKSTLLKILSKITEPTSGRIELNGRVAALLEVGTGFHPELTGRENIYMNGTILGMTKKEIDRKLEEIIDFSGVGKYVDTPVKFYSSGMRVRLGFSVAAHLEPEILIVDEVLAVGDYEFQQKCLWKMENVSQNEGRTVLFVSHNMGAIKSLCRTGLYLDCGEINSYGSTNKIIENYLTTGKNLRVNEEKVIYPDSGRGEYCQVEFIKQDRYIKFFCGEKFSFKLTFESEEEIENLGVSFLIKRADDLVILGTGSQVQGLKIKGKSKKWYCNVDLGCIPINEGNYYIDLYFVSGEFEIAKFSKAMYIEVIGADVFGWGKPIPDSKNWGSFYWETKWEIKNG